MSKKLGVMAILFFTFLLGTLSGIIFVFYALYEGVSK